MSFASALLSNGVLAAPARAASKILPSTCSGFDFLYAALNLPSLNLSSPPPIFFIKSPPTPLADFLKLLRNAKLGPGLFDTNPEFIENGRSLLTSREMPFFPLDFVSA